MKENRCGKQLRHGDRLLQLRFIRYLYKEQVMQHAAQEEARGDFRASKSRCAK